MQFRFWLSRSSAARTAGDLNFRSVPSHRFTFWSNGLAVELLTSVFIFLVFWASWWKWNPPLMVRLMELLHLLPFRVILLPHVIRDICLLWPGILVLLACLLLRRRRMMIARGDYVISLQCLCLPRNIMTLNSDPLWIITSCMVPLLSRGMLITHRIKAYVGNTHCYVLLILVTPCHDSGQKYRKYIEMVRECVVSSCGNSVAVWTAPVWD